jgi:hypothetical protein
MSIVFNKRDFKSSSNDCCDDDDDNNDMYINRYGDNMIGNLSTPTLILTSINNPLQFPNGSYQSSAFNETNEIIVNMQSDISDVTFAIEEIPDLQTKTTNISYLPNPLNKTTISNNCFITNLECGNINTSHLSGTTSNLQTQINSIASNNITAPLLFIDLIVVTLLKKSL